MKTSPLMETGASRGFEKCHHLTFVFKGSLLRTDCKGRSRESSYEATAGTQVSERGWWQWEGEKEADSGYISQAESTGLAKTGGGV